MDDENFAYTFMKRIHREKVNLSVLSTTESVVIVERFNDLQQVSESATCEMLEEDLSSFQGDLQKDLV